MGKALRCRAPEAYNNIERMLIYAMRSLPLPPGFREHHEDDAYIGPWQEVLHEICIDLPQLRPEKGGSAALRSFRSPSFGSRSCA